MTYIKERNTQQYFIDLVFPVHKLGIEIDESGHLDRCEIKEQERQEIKKKKWI